MKKATTIDEQIRLMQERGMAIHDKTLAAKMLQTVGYYRFGAYCFPLEINARSKKCPRTHQYRQGASFDDAYTLLLFDKELSFNILWAIREVELHFKSNLVYHVSNNPEYHPTPCWYADSRHIDDSFLNSKFRQEYNSLKRKPTAIGRHHALHKNDKFAPVWKAIEAFTFGSVVRLYSAIRSHETRLQIATLYGIENEKILESYLKVVLFTRNLCAHAGIVYDMRLSKPIRRGPAGKMNQGEQSGLGGVLKILLFLLKGQDEAIYSDFLRKMENLFNDYRAKPIIQEQVGTTFQSIFPDKFAH